MTEKIAGPAKSYELARYKDAGFTSDEYKAIQAKLNRHVWAMSEAVPQSQLPKSISVQVKGPRGILTFVYTLAGGRYAGARGSTVLGPGMTTKAGTIDMTREVGLIPGVPLAKTPRSAPRLPGKFTKGWIRSTMGMPEKAVEQAVTAVQKGRMTPMGLGEALGSLPPESIEKLPARPYYEPGVRLPRPEMFAPDLRRPFAEIAGVSPGRAKKLHRYLLTGLTKGKIKP
jgi:hypothetical protein